MGTIQSVFVVKFAGTVDKRIFAPVGSRFSQPQVVGLSRVAHDCVPVKSEAIANGLGLRPGDRAAYNRSG